MLQGASKSVPMTLPRVATVVYFDDDQGFSLKLHVWEAASEGLGFRQSASNTINASTWMLDEQSLRQEFTLLFYAGCAGGIP